MFDKFISDEDFKLYILNYNCFMDLRIKKTDEGYMIMYDFKSAMITKIYDNDEQVFHIYLEDGSCYEISRCGELGTFLTKFLRKQKLKQIDGKG